MRGCERCGGYVAAPATVCPTCKGKRRAPIARCVDCARPAATGRQRCAKHLDAARAQQKRYADARRASGRCTTCPQAATPGRKRCDVCRAKARAASLAARFDLTEAEYAQRLADQGGRCAICRDDTPGGHGRFHVDHDHETGHVRGLLCVRCNLGLGYFRDRPPVLVAAVRYLREHADAVADEGSLCAGDRIAIDAE